MAGDEIANIIARRNSDSHKARYVGRVGYLSNSRWHEKDSVKQEQREHLEAVMQNSSTPLDVRWRIFKTLFDRRFTRHEEKMKFVMSWFFYYLCISVISLQE